MGFVGKLNTVLRGLRFALPAIGTAMTNGINAETPRRLLNRYSGFDLNEQKFVLSEVKKAAGFYVGNVVESKVMNAVRIPQMAGRKKILAIAANFLPEISAAPAAVAGNWGEAVNQLGLSSIGYKTTDNQTWLENPTVREAWLKALGARVGLGLFSRFAGPVINKYLPKGVNV